MKIYNSGSTALVIWRNFNRNSSRRNGRYHENSEISWKIWIICVSKTNGNEVKEQKSRFVSMLLGTLGASLLGNLLTSKGSIRAVEGMIRTGADN